MKDTLCAEERINLCRKLLNEGCHPEAPPEVRETAIQAVFEILSSGYVQPRWLKLIERKCQLYKGALDHYVKLAEFRSKK